jgi:nitrite reductase (NADH) large subunit
MNQSKTSWRCNVCGYVHQGETAPEYCPICGASASDFTLFEEPTLKPAQTAANQWRCIICTYIHKGEGAPDACPICGAEPEQFEPIHEIESSEKMNADSTKIIIVGGGIAGVSAAESVRKNSADSLITLISTDPEIPYYRLNLTRYLAGEISTDELIIHPENYYSDNNIELLSGQSVEMITKEDKTVSLSNGKVLPYDQLILTAGSHPFVPPLQSSNVKGVYTLRTVADANRIIQKIEEGIPCICIGGGILGLETAGALTKRGGNVTLLESHEWLMPRQLNESAALRLESHMSTLGVKLRKSVQTNKVIQSEGKVTGVELEKGEEIPCGMVVICTGVRPNTFLARKAGLEVNRGVVVDHHLRSSDPSIFAAGDIAECNGIVYGIWGPAQYQGSIAGLNALGGETVFGGVPRSNTLKVLDIEMLSIGEFSAQDGSYRVIESEDSKIFQHFVFKDGKMVGAILLGNTEPTAKIKSAIENKKDFSAVLGNSPDCSAILQAL